MVLHGALGQSKRWSHQSKWEAVDEVQKLVPEQFRRLCREDAEDVTTYDTVEDWVVPDLRDEDPDACDRRWSTGCDPILHPGMKGMKALIDDETRSAELKQMVFDNLYAFENGFNHPEPCPKFGNKSRARRDFLKDMKAVKESHSMKDSLMALARRLSKYGSTRRRETLREEFRFQVNVACGIPHEPSEHHRHARLDGDASDYEGSDRYPSGFSTESSGIRKIRESEAFGRNIVDIVNGPCRAPFLRHPLSYRHPHTFYNRLSMTRYTYDGTRCDRAFKKLLPMQFKDEDGNLIEDEVYTAPPTLGTTNTCYTQPSLKYGRDCYDTTSNHSDDDREPTASCRDSFFHGSFVDASSCSLPSYLPKSELLSQASKFSDRKRKNEEKFEDWLERGLLKPRKSCSESISNFEFEHEASDEGESTPKSPRTHDKESLYAESMSASLLSTPHQAPSSAASSPSPRRRTQRSMGWEGRGWDRGLEGDGTGDGTGETK